MKKTLALALLVLGCGGNPTGPDKHTCLEKVYGELYRNGAKLHASYGRPEYAWDSPEQKQFCREEYDLYTSIGDLTKYRDNALLALAGKPLTVRNMTSSHVTRIIIDGQTFQGDQILLAGGGMWIRYFTEKPNSILVVWTNGVVSQHSVSDDWEVRLS